MTRPHKNEVNYQNRNLGNKLLGGWNLRHLTIFIDRTDKGHKNPTYHSHHQEHDSNVTYSWTLFLLLPKLH